MKSFSFSGLLVILSVNFAVNAMALKDLPDEISQTVSNLKLMLDQSPLAQEPEELSDIWLQYLETQSDLSNRYIAQELYSRLTCMDPELNVKIVTDKTQKNTKAKKEIVPKFINPYPAWLKSESFTAKHAILIYFMNAAREYKAVAKPLQVPWRVAQEMETIWVTNPAVYTILMAHANEVEPYRISEHAQRIK